MTNSGSIRRVLGFAALCGGVIVPFSAQAQTCASDTTNKKSEPFAFADFTWFNGNPRTKDSPLKTSYFTGEFRADVTYIGSFNHPSDHTLVGTSESGRTSEVQLQQLGIGGDFSSDKLKIEPWLVNGWQSDGMFNEAPGVGAQILWRPNGNVSLLTNVYYGHDWLGIPNRWRLHSDNSLQVKYYENQKHLLSKAAFSLTADIGCESGSGVSCTGGKVGAPKQSFVGYMVYNRAWFAHDEFALTLGTGSMNNPGRYLVLLPPINGATAFSGTPYFTANPRDVFKAWDTSVTFDFMPDQYSTFRVELNHREANVPYFAGPRGVTPPRGNAGPAGSVIAGFVPDLRRTETRVNVALLVKL